MKDFFDQIVSCQSAQALEAYERAVDHQLHAWPGAIEALDLALQHEPEFALAHSTRALVLQSYGRRAEALEASAKAQQLTQLVTERERSHIDVVRLLVEGKTVLALETVRAHAQRWPTDALVMSTALGAFGLIAFSGRLDHDQERLEFVWQLAPHYPQDFPWMLSHQGWTLVECNQPEAGLPFVSRSLELRSANGNAAHVMMHAQFELNAPEAGLAFAQSWIDQYPENAMLYGHVHWHAALCELDLGHPELALNRLLAVIEPHLAFAPPLVGLTDTSALLWRLRLLGFTGLSWANAQQFAQTKLPNGGNLFAEVHLAMLAAGTGDTQGLLACQARVRKQMDAGHLAAPVALHWVDALLSLLHNDQDAARVELAQCVPESARLGGSHAQRTIISRTQTWLG